MTPRTRRWSALGVLGALLVAVVAVDVAQVGTLDGTRGQLAAASVRLRGARAAVEATGIRTRTARADLAATEATDARTVAAAAAARRAETGLDDRAGLQTVDLTILRSCLAGVSTAVGDSRAGDLPATVHAVTAAAPACEALDGAGDGLVYPFDFPDPYVLDVPDGYDAFATNSVAGSIQVIHSTDLTHWTAVGDALPALPSWATPHDVWAPSVLLVGTTYVMYYSVVQAATGIHCVSDATSTVAAGPYVDTSTGPLVCQAADGGSIDPSPYVAPDGSLSLVWKSEGTPSRPPAIWSQPLTPAGTALAPGSTPSELLAPDEGWQAGVVEGPTLVSVAGRVDLLYSGNDWWTAGYAVGWASCAGPAGPCRDRSATPLLTGGGGLAGPGGPAVFTDHQGRTWLAVHAWLTGEVGEPNSRVLVLRPLAFTGDVPTVGS